MIISNVDSDQYVETTYLVLGGRILLSYEVV